MSDNGQSSASVDVRIGTSGYSFDDWRGRFYPEKTVKGKMLDYYVQHFRTVEINSTYYRIPHPAVMANITRKAPNGFDFMVKVPQSFTHRRSDLEDDLAKYREALSPMVESGKLAGLLAQFPYSFKFSPDGLDYLQSLRLALAEFSLFAEFRHDSWVNRTMYDRLRSDQTGYVCVDEPELPGLLKPDLFCTTKTAYVRLHGRNAQQWWDGGPLRYDYSYSEDEMREWKERIDKLIAKKKADRVYVFFNNCHHGQAASNAVNFEAMFGV
ncbi:MAG: DUF72 domain-containing protein [candidate division Zixibacteria bacterium]|nr:DUF72 domain-containing protein [candidate division Zixibacteria bacterium]MDH3938347.1 DUF72 domain-containing protein [candidate division Zixibacteria bacterium]MDH4034692.1 DUF72 domain-containing protein [candidate division Zixibacteria bacterium]